jgi:hypothetical protein
MLRQGIVKTFWLSFGYGRKEELTDLRSTPSGRSWLALEDDFRTPGIGQIVAELPPFDLIMHHAK